MFSDVGADDRVALLAPLSFITGAVTAVGAALTGGTGHVFDAATEDLTQLPDWLDEHRITLLGLTVSLVTLLATAVNGAGRTIDSLRFVGLGGEHGSADDFAQALRAFPNAELRHIYGMTETGGIAHHQMSLDRRARRRTGAGGPTMAVGARRHRRRRRTPGARRRSRRDLGHRAATSRSATGTSPR